MITRVLDILSVHRPYFRRFPRNGIAPLSRLCACLPACQTSLSKCIARRVHTLLLPGGEGGSLCLPHPRMVVLEDGFPLSALLCCMHWMGQTPLLPAA